MTSAPQWFKAKQVEARGTRHELVSALHLRRGEEEGQPRRKAAANGAADEEARRVAKALSEDRLAEDKQEGCPSQQVDQKKRRRQHGLQVTQQDAQRAAKLLSLHDG